MLLTLLEEAHSCSSRVGAMDASEGSVVRTGADGADASESMAMPCWPLSIMPSQRPSRSSLSDWDVVKP